MKTSSMFRNLTTAYIAVALTLTLIVCAHFCGIRRTDGRLLGEWQSETEPQWTYVFAPNGNGYSCLTRAAAIGDEWKFPMQWWIGSNDDLCVQSMHVDRQSVRCGPFQISNRGSVLHLFNIPRFRSSESLFKKVRRK